MIYLKILFFCLVNIPFIVLAVYGGISAYQLYKGDERVQQDFQDEEQRRELKRLNRGIE